MKFKNFKLMTDFKKHSDLITQHQNQLKQLDQVLEQFKNQDPTTFWDQWSLYYENDQFELSYNDCSLKSKDFNELLNPLHLQQMYQIWITPVAIENDNEMWHFNYDIDMQQIKNIRDNFQSNSYQIINFKFKDFDFTMATQLFKTCVDFNEIIYKQEKQKQLLDQSFTMQLFKKVIDQSVKTKTALDQSILKWCQQQLNQQPQTFRAFENSLYHAQESKNQLLAPVWDQTIDWGCCLTINSKLQQINVDFVVFDSTNDEEYKLSPLQLTFKEFAKIVNDHKFNSIIAQWKNPDYQKANHIFNKF